MGKKSAANLVEQIERSKARRVLAADLRPGHPPRRRAGAQALAGAFGSMDALTGASVEQLQAVPEIGPVVAAAVRGYFDEPRNRRLIARARAAGLKMDAPLRRRDAPGR